MHDKPYFALVYGIYRSSPVRHATSNGLSISLAFWVGEYSYNSQRSIKTVESCCEAMGVQSAHGLK